MGGIRSVHFFTVDCSSDFSVLVPGSVSGPGPSLLLFLYVF
jgi:hypothetical protein